MSGGDADQAFVVECLNDLLAQALDVEGAARDEVAQALDPLAPDR